MIPLVDVKAQYAPLIPELQERFAEVLESGRFILGPNVSAFEREAAAYLGVPETIGVANGTDAIVLVLDALGVGGGDEVICPAFTFYATAEAIVQSGATPVFADIDPATLNLDPDDVAARITPRTKAIMPVHLFGRPAPLSELAALGVPVVEDAAQAFGATGIATTGVASTFSFFPTKNLFALGDGGLVAATDEELADRVRRLRFHGSRDKVDFDLIGYNSRLDELQAAALRLFLPQLDGWNRARREAAALYAELGLGEACELPPDDAGARLPHVRRPDPGAGAPRVGAGRGGDRLRLLLRDPASPPAGPALSRLGAGIASGDRAGRSREPRAADVGGNRPGDAGAGGLGDPGGGAGQERDVTFPINRHRIWQLAVDTSLVAAAWYLAFRLRFDPRIPPYYHTLLTRTIWIVILIQVAVFVLFGFYNRWWRYVSTRDMWGAARGVTVACLVSSVVVYFASPVQQIRLPRSVAIMDWLLLLAFVAGARMLARTLMERPTARGLVARGKEVIVVGAGDAAQLIVKEMLRSPSLGYTPIGLVDDDPKKKNLRLHNVRVLGTTADLPRILGENRPDEVLIAIPSASGEVRQRVVDITREAAVPVKTLPGIYELISGDVDLAGQIRPVQVEDVLGREPVEVDLHAVAEYLADATVLVTGAGGSIGSELCRQIARIGCRRLILVERGETALFEIERELVSERGFAPSVPVLADAGSRERMRRVFERYTPSVVFHAAAYKHVPLMEANPLESVRNNTLATKAIAEVAAEFGVERFVLVSTDKAVNPKTVMGQSKALCEWIVEAYGARTDVLTRFVAVRFGNVLGSSGSVIPIFRRQIERGGPVGVTHPEMTRYFMTIPEAVSLVVQAGSIGRSGQVFVLDMGEPVSILELARNMVRLSGKEPDRDIPIEFVGVRPGEKLHEELWGDGESVGSTLHPKILAVTRPAIDAAWLEDELGELRRLVDEGETLELVSRLGAMIKEPRRGRDVGVQTETVS